jgi:intracellular multiplication protein IcmQ
MRELDDNTKYAIAILKALNKTLDEGPWDSNLFYKAIGQQIKDLRDKFKDDLNLDEILATGLPATIAKRVAQRSGLVEVFISLYLIQGSQINKWESLLYNITDRAITRPIYANEADAKAALRGAVNKQTEAYAAAYIKAEDILPPGENPPQDRFGHLLLTIRENAVTRDNITRLVHISGVYEYEHDKLIRQSSVDFL